jgi:hypothetical protein
MHDNVLPNYSRTNIDDVTNGLFLALSKMDRDNIVGLIIIDDGICCVDSQIEDVHFISSEIQDRWPKEF